MTATINHIGQVSGSTGPLVTSAGDTVGGPGTEFVVGISYDSGVTIVSVADNVAGSPNTYSVSAQGTAHAGGSGHSKVFYTCPNGVGRTGHQITVTFSGDPAGSVYFDEVRGIATSSAYDTGQKATPGVSPFTMNIPTLAQADEIGIMLAGDSSSTPVYASSNTTIIAEEDDGTLYWTSFVSKFTTTSTEVSPGVGYAPAWTDSSGSTDTAMLALTFKAAGGGTGYSLTADSGTYTVSGQSVNLIKATPYSLAAATGFYTIVGSSAQIDLAIAAAPGSYTVAGQAVTLSFNGRTDYTLVASSGTYTVAGQTVALTYKQNSIVCITGSYNVAGQAATLLKNGVPTGGDGVSGQGVSGLGVSGLDVSGLPRSPSGPPF